MRRFTASRKVRLGDANRRGRLRLDAIARYLQDVANDDAVDAAVEDAQIWVLRKVAFEIEAFPRLNERLTITTWCSGVGGRWAERRTDIGDHIRTTALWVYVDPKTLLPARLPQVFFDVWAPAAEGRKVRARLTHQDPPADCRWSEWPLRATDHDILDHMNNAAYWHPVEQLWGDRPIARAEIEYRTPITPDQSVVIGALDDGRLWLADAATHAVHASVVVRFG